MKYALQQMKYALQQVKSGGFYVWWRRLARDKRAEALGIAQGAEVDAGGSGEGGRRGMCGGFGRDCFRNASFYTSGPLGVRPQNLSPS
jgi:hypothetical protein